MQAAAGAGTAPVCRTQKPPRPSPSLTAGSWSASRCLLPRAVLLPRTQLSCAAARRQLKWSVRAVPDSSSDVSTLDFSKVAELIASAPLQDDQTESLAAMAAALDIPLATAKQMAFKRRGLLSMGPQEVRGKVALLAQIVEVPYEQAKAMAIIQPGLLFDTTKQAETLLLGIRAICYELKAPKEEVVSLILNHQSILHGREMHLSVADIAHLAMLREPRGRIAE